MIPIRKAYIATSLLNAETQMDLARRLREIRVTVSYDWTIHGSTLSDGPELRGEVADDELRAVGMSGIVIVILPGGRGTHVELGAALMTGLPIILWTNGRDILTPETHCGFYWHPNVTRIQTTDLEDVVRAVEETLREVI